SREVLGQLDFHAAVASVDKPATTHFRSWPCRQFDMAISRMEVHLVQHAIDGNVAVTRTGADVAGEVAHLNGSIASVDAHWATGSIHIDVPVTGVQIEGSFRRYLHVDADSTVMQVNVKSDFVGDVDRQIDFVAILMFADADITRLVAFTENMCSYR